MVHCIKISGGPSPKPVIIRLVLKSQKPLAGRFSVWIELIFAQSLGQNLRQKTSLYFAIVVLFISSVIGGISENIRELADWDAEFRGNLHVAWREQRAVQGDNPCGKPND